MHHKDRLSAHQGGEALAFVRSRHLYYYQDGGWYYDGLSDFSRIQRQDAFFRAICPRLRRRTTNPLNAELASSALRRSTSRSTAPCRLERSSAWRGFSADFQVPSS